MMRVSGVIESGVLTLKNVGGLDPLLSRTPNIQCVRWKRKPIWMPTAKSKIFRVPKKPVLPEVEVVELRRLTNNYKTAMRSIRTFFYKLKEQEASSRLDTSQIKLDQEMKVRMDINRRWNEQIAAEREKRLEKERQERQLEIVKHIEQTVQEEQLLLQKIEEHVAREKKLAAEFITIENIDRAIAEAMATVVNHNVPINERGEFLINENEKLANQRKTETAV